MVTDDRGGIMGIFDFFKKKKQDTSKYKYASTLNGSTPIFSQFGNSIYASDVVQGAINCIVQEMKKKITKFIM